MPASITMTNRQKVSAGISVVDQDGQAITTPPPGLTVTFTSSNDLVAPVIQDPANAFNCEVTSGQVGSAIVTAEVAGLGPAPVTDTLAVSIINSAPGSLNFTVGTPIDE